MAINENMAQSEVRPDEFQPERHFYPRVRNAVIHPLVRFFMDLGNKRVADRYCHLHPEAAPEAVHALLSRPTRWFRWAGCDLFHVATERGARRVMVIETNSCPSGQKSMPRLSERQERGGYETLIQRVFLPLLCRPGLPAGGLAVIYDKNLMEASGYAAMLADATGETVHVVPFWDREGQPARVDDGVLRVRINGGWEPIRACMRYVTQRPWNRLPALPRTAMLNPVLVCLAGGRNKLLAAKAYDLYNADVAGQGLRINAPQTMSDVTRGEVPLCVARLGGVAVVKSPYSNAGQAVWTITNSRELERFMAMEQRYKRFIVQALIGNKSWSSRGTEGSLYHVGTVPNRHDEIFVTDVRFMVAASADGFQPVSIYARRARQPMASTLPPGADSWSMLGTNLSMRLPDGGWETETERLLLMDGRDFNTLGLGLDDLIEGYLQTVMSVTAIDRMACDLVTSSGRLRRRLFRSLTPDPVLCDEIMPD